MVSMQSTKEMMNQSLPPNMMPFVEETLRDYVELTEKEVKELREGGESFVFFFDAFDELMEWQHLHVKNRLHLWKGMAKMVVTCRTHYLNEKPRVYKRYFQTRAGSSYEDGPDQYQEWFVAAVQEATIEQYVEAYAASRPRQDLIPKGWESAGKYLRELKRIPSLMALIRTPFSLKITLEVLPKLVASDCVTQILILCSVFNF